MYLNYTDFLYEINQNKICQVVETVLLLNSKEETLLVQQNVNRFSPTRI